MKTLRVQEPVALFIHGNAEMYGYENADIEFEMMGRINGCSYRGVCNEWMDEESNLQGVCNEWVVDSPYLDDSFLCRPQWRNYTPIL